MPTPGIGMEILFVEHRDDFIRHQLAVQLLNDDIPNVRSLRFGIFRVDETDLRVRLLVEQNDCPRNPPRQFFLLGVCKMIFGKMHGRILCPEKFGIFHDHPITDIFFDPQLYPFVLRRRVRFFHPLCRECGTHDDGQRQKTKGLLHFNFHLLFDWTRRKTPHPSVLSQNCQHGRSLCTRTGKQAQ